MGKQDKLQNVEEALAEMLKMQEQLQSKLTDQEGHSRRSNIRIYGVPKGTEGKPRSMITFEEKIFPSVR